MAHKTKAAMQGRQCEETKQDQHTRPGAGGQSLSDTGIPAAAHEITGVGNLLNNKQSAKLSFVSPEISGDQANVVGVVLPGSFGVAKMQLGQLPGNFRQWRRCTAAPHTPRAISPNLGRLIFKRHLSCPLTFLRFCEPLRVVHRVTQSCSVLELAQPFGSSLASLRWRRLISPRKAATINCPVLSPASFTFSISSITSCGTREAICVDLLLLRPVAMTIPRCIRCLALYTKKIEKKGLRWLAPLCKVVSTLVVLRVKNSEARQCWNTNRASDHNVIEAYIMADQQHTQTHSKFTWRFLALSSIGCNIIHISANTEREAREQSPDGCVMVFAGRLPVREVRHEHA